MSKERQYRRKLKVEKADVLSPIEEEVNNLSEAIMESLRKNLPETSGVYKLFYGDRYVIVKGKTVAGSLFLIVKGYAYFLFGGQGTGNGLQEPFGKGRRLNVGANEFYWPLYTYIKKHPGLTWHMERILIDDNGYNLLRAEQDALDAAQGDKKCLNTNKEAYIPKKNEKTGMHGWISAASVGAFNRFTD